MEKVVAAVDLGGTNLRVALVARDGRLVWRKSTPTLAQEGEKAVFERLVSALRDAVGQAGGRQVVGMGIGIAGPVRQPEGIVASTPNLRGWDNVPLKSLLESRFSFPIRIENDANLAALGEHRYGAGRGTRHMIYITVSTGIGGGVISCNKLLNGADGFASEIGHIKVMLDGPKCNCGGRGCVEALASGSGMVMRAQEAIGAGRASLLAGADHITTEMVIEAARRGDSVARGVVDTAINALGHGIASLLHLFNPEMVVIGGGVSQSWDQVIAPVIPRVAQLVMMPEFARRVRIVRAQLGDAPVLLGAAALFEEVFDLVPSDML